MKDVRCAFPECGNALVQDWISKKLVSCEKAVASGGNAKKTYWKFSAAEILHTGVVSQLSLFGALRNRGVLVWLDDGKSQAAPSSDLLEQPDKIIEHYKRLEFNVGIVITGTLSPKIRTEPRAKGESYSCLIRIMPYGDPTNSLMRGRSRVRLDRQPTPEQERTVQNAFQEWYEAGTFQDRNVAFISIPALVRAMKSQGITL